MDLLEIVETIALTGVTVTPTRELDTLAAVANMVKWNARLSQSVTGAKMCITCLLSSTRERTLWDRLGCGLLWHFKEITITGTLA